jgi:glucose/arabinose dehydrogenase
VVATDLATGLEVPWGAAVLPDGATLVSERVSARIDRIPADGGARRTIGTVPGVEAGGEGGLLGLAISPTYATDRLVYAYLGTADDNRVVTMSLRGDRLGAPRAIVTGIPKGPIHDGGRIAFGPDGKLWITTGDAGIRELAQDRDSLAGKILRAEPDGSVPADNPFGTLVWSYGHRNVQGIAWDSGGQPWATEFGQSTFDELNLIRKGANYGWPLIEGVGRRDGFEDPAVTWRTDEASPSGLAIVDDIAYVGALRGQRLWQVPLRGDQAGEPSARLTDSLGRLRTVVAAPGGKALLVTTSNRDGRGSPRDGDDRVVLVSLAS